MVSMMSSPKHVSAHKFVWPELAFGVFTYIYQCFNTHLQNKGLSWDCHLLDKNSTFPHTLAQVLQDGDLLFTDTDPTHISTVQPPWIQVIKLRHFEDITWRRWVKSLSLLQIHHCSQQCLPILFPRVKLRSLHHPTPQTWDIAKNICSQRRGTQFPTTRNRAAGADV